MLRSTTLLLPSLLLSLASFARAGLTEMRATLPGSLHQCDATNVFFFDTDDSGSKTLLLVSPSDADSLGPGVLTLSSVLGQITPLQAIDGIDSPDATQFDFTLKIAEGTSFAALGFLSNGQGKNLNLPREVQSPLPSNANCLSGQAAAAAQPASSSSSSSSSSSTSPAPAPTTATPSSTSVTPSSTVTPSSSSSSSSSPQYASRFVTSVRSSSSSSTAKAISSIATSSAAISASLSLPPNSTATGTRASSGGNATSTGGSPAAAATSPVVVSAKYLLSSFIEISDDQSTDGAISSASIKGGFVTGSVNGTILPIGNALFAANSSIAANATAEAGPGTSLISASYSFTDEETGETVFVMAQTPLAQNFTTEALLMTFQSAQANSSAFANMTILGRPQTVNETMFRIDAYYLPTSEV